MPSACNLLDTYGLSKSYGFLPEQPPLESFQDNYYSPWDDLITQLPQLVASHTLGPAIAALPVLSTQNLASDAELQRAYVVLSFLVHSIVWGSREDGVGTELIPAQVTEPYFEVCERLGMQQVLSYAGLCIWNWRPRHGEKRLKDGFYELAQLKSVASFMDSRGEDTFYHVPVLIEAEAGHLVHELLTAVDAAAEDDVAAVTKALRHTAEVFERMIKHLPKLYNTLDANMFYHDLRPFLAGGKGMEEKGLQRGFVFQRNDGSEIATKQIGGSAAQSSMFQFLDAVLGVEHVAPKDGSQSIFQAHASDAELCQAFDSALKQLRTWRSTHIAVVSKYVVRPARQAAQAECDTNGGALGTAEFEAANGEELQGTAGSALIPFLKQSRDETSGLS